MSNGQSESNNEKEKKENLPSFGQENGNTSDENYKDFDFSDDNKENAGKERYDEVKTTKKRWSTRKKKDKRLISDNSQYSDNFDDLDYTLESENHYDRKSRSNENWSKYNRSLSNSRSSRASRINNSIGSINNSKTNSDNHSKSRRSDSSNGSTHSGWKPEEDARLREAISLYGTLDWMKISNFVGNGRTRSQCSQRWHRCLDPHISKEKWTEEEIETLKRLVIEYGERSWARIASRMEKRCDVQCRYMYKRIINKKSIRGLPSNLNSTDAYSKSDNESTEMFEDQGNNFDKNSNNENNFSNTIQNTQINAPIQNGFVGAQNNFSLHQTNFPPPSMNYGNKVSNINDSTMYNAFNYQNPFIQFNNMRNNYNQGYQNNETKEQGVPISIFPVSENVFSLFDIQTQSKFPQPNKPNMNLGVMINNNVPQALPLQPSQNTETKDSDISYFQISDPVIKTTQIDEFMAGLSSSVRYKY